MSNSRQQVQPQGSKQAQKTVVGGGMTRLAKLVSLSVIASALAACQPEQQEFVPSNDGNGLVSIEAESFHLSVAGGQQEWAPVEDAAQYSGGLAMSVRPNSGAAYGIDVLDGSPRLDYLIQFKQAGTYYVWVLGHGNGSAEDDSVHIGLDGQVTAASAHLDFNLAAAPVWSNQTAEATRAQVTVSEEGARTLNLWMSEDGFVADKIVLTTNPDYVPQGVGPDQSEQAGAGNKDGSTDTGGNTGGSPDNGGESDNGGNPAGSPDNGGESDNGGNPAGSPDNGGESDNGGNTGGSPDNGGETDNGGNTGDSPDNGGETDNGGNTGDSPDNGGETDNGGSTGGSPDNGGETDNGGNTGGSPDNGGETDNGGNIGDSPDNGDTVDNGGDSDGSTDNGATDPVLHSVQLSWSAPTTREDGSPLSMSELGGYKLKYGTNSGQYPNEIDINDPYMTEYTLSELEPSNYYFVLVAYDVNGIESPPSNEAVKSVGQ